MIDLIGQFTVAAMLLAILSCLVTATTEPNVEPAQSEYQQCVNSFQKETDCLSNSNSNCIIQMTARCGLNHESE